MKSDSSRLTRVKNLCRHSLLPLTHGGPQLKRILDNLFVDLIAAALMIAMVATGYILRFPLPPGTNKSLSLWGLTRHQWGTIHFWISLGLLLLVLVHLCLHWPWIVISVKRRLGIAASPSSSPLKSGLLTVLILSMALAIFGWAAQTGVRPIAEQLQSDSTTVQVRVAFWSDVYPIFEKSCLHCHGPSKQISDFRVDHRDEFFAGTNPLVVAGNSKDSPLIVILSGERKDMARAEVHRLAEDQVALVRAWIDAGAEWPDRPVK